MTVSYTLKVANASFGCFFKLLFRWKGSIYKLLYKEFIVFCCLYAMLSVTYRCLLNEKQKSEFAQLARYCNQYTDLIPVSFVLGFYVTLIVNRWWAQYTNIPLPDQLMCVVSSNVHGGDERGRLLRRTMMRYANLSSVLILRSVSTRVLKRFPTMEHIVEAGFMTREELKKYECLFSDYNKYWIPCVWFTNLAAQARRDGRVRDDVALKLLMDELNKYRAKCSMLFHYDWISVPLVYTQVVTIAVYSFFGVCIIGRQFLEPELEEEKPNIDLYVPIFTLLQFFFYSGWLKVAQQIINPFGEDDDDFETNRLIDRNLQVSLLSVDDMYQNLPPLEKDKYWDDQTAAPPYTLATAAETLKPSFMGSAFDMRFLGDAEQSQQVAVTPNMPRARTPMLSRFLSSAPSPAVSLKNFMGRGTRGHHLVRFRGDGYPSPNPNSRNSDLEHDSVGRIDEEETTEDEKESRASEPPTPKVTLRVPRRLEASEQQKKREQPKPPPLVIIVDEPSDESLNSEPAEC
ncbi:bestrophin-4 [Xenopus tropicalis]|uniref:Bestrophin homolog n=1 Tax=Xenopus tropicalis TaxID=8364 RepID=B1WBH4_XENTR|nr:bestrophin-4 [Xenopus tropicalis]AAI61756.1 best4 protein [Xenopus tropicalis]|eukprot:NP_001116914.1 bestrophin-4 [Xenopus tropicalis]